MLPSSAMKNVSITFTAAQGFSVTVSASTARFGLNYGQPPEGPLTPELLRATAVEIERARALVQAAEEGA